MDKDLYDLPKEELKTIPTVCGSCARRWNVSTRIARSSRTAACSTTIFIDSYIELKMNEVDGSK